MPEAKDLHADGEVAALGEEELAAVAGGSGMLEPGEELPPWEDPLWQHDPSEVTIRFS